MRLLPHIGAWVLSVAKQIRLSDRIGAMMRKPPSEALLVERSRIVGFNGATLTKLERSVSKGYVYGKTF